MQQRGDYVEKDLVSVIVPVYNVAEFLEESINSLLSQTYSNIEVLLIDDGSVDASPEKCNGLASRDPRCRVIHKENKGVSDTRNAGLQEARGEYIMFFDSDDILEKDTVEICVSRIRGDGTDAVFFGMMFDSYHDGVCIKQVPHCVLNDEVICKEMFDKKFQYLANNNYISSCCNKLLKKDILDKNNLKFNVDLANYEDYLFSLQLMEFLDSVSVISVPLYHYMRRERTGLSRRYVDRYDEKMEILISEVTAAFERLCFVDEKTNSHRSAMYIYWMTLVLMNYANEQGSVRKKISKIKDYISRSAVKKRFHSERTSNKFAGILRFFACHNMAAAIYLLCMFKLKYKEKNY